MSDLALATSNENAIPVHIFKTGEVGGSSALSSQHKNWAKANGFDGQAGRVLLVPNNNGQIASVLFGCGKANDFNLPLMTGTLGSKLPRGTYEFASILQEPHLAALGWVLGSYTFSQYKQRATKKAKLVLPSEVDKERLQTEANATFLARDLINTPANDLGPEQLETVIRKIAKSHKAKVSITKGDDLLKNNYPMIHAVGRASTDAPRLIDMIWGKETAPKVTLVGKGVIFDSGGLNIKPGNSMALMKKDMGGAANCIALAQMIMESKLPVRLRLLIPAVENAISGNAFRPGDILPSRKGINVEIGNTDAEGRLILGDALTLGDEETPELMIDMATLTGAARVALGPDLPPFYTDNHKLADEITTSAETVCDPLWQMPLWPPYQKMLSSKIADVNHISSNGFAGSITAALFLSRFVENCESWAHFDVYGWTPTAKPWSPVGGEAQGIRALFDMMWKRFGR